MSEEDKIYAFVAFGIESYKQAKGLSGAEAAQKFARYGVDEYLRDEYVGDFGSGFYVTSSLDQARSVCCLLEFVRSEEVQWVK